MFKNLLGTLVYGGMEIFIIALFIFFIVHHLIIKHLVTIARYVGTITYQSDCQPLAVTKSVFHHTRDEIGQVVTAINRMTEDLRNSFQEINREVIERRRAEEAETSSRKLLRDIIDNSLSPVYVFDVEGRFLLVNRKFESLIGVVQEQLLGKTREAFMSSGTAASHRQNDLKVLAGLEPMIFEEELLVADGLHRYRSVKFPLIDPQGQVLGIGGISIDMTEQMNLVNNLRRSEAFLDNIIEQSLLSMWISDETGTLLRLNQACRDLLGIQTEEVVGKYNVLQDNIVTEQGLMPQVRRVFENGEAANFRLFYDSTQLKHLELQNRKSVILDVTISPVKDGTGKVTNAIIQHMDITRQHQQEEELRHLADDLEGQVLERTLDLDETQNALLNLLDDMNMAKEQLEEANKKLQDMDRLKSMFIASMSHELRTPLNSVIGFSSILVDEWLGPLNDEQKMNMNSILRSGKHLLSLINDVIDISKIEAGTLEPTIESFDLADLLADAADSLRQAAQDKGLTLTIQTVSYPLQTDRRRLLQILLNFLSNGVKFTAQGAVTLAVEISADQERLALAVSDTGIGILQEDIGKLFKPFSRLHDAGSSVYPGTGLGLYLCSKIAHDILHGEVAVQSVVGQGSTFRVTLPVRVAVKKQDLPVVEYS